MISFRFKGIPDAVAAEVWQERVGDRDPDQILKGMFDLGGVAYVHVRNGDAGCFMARVESSLP